MQNCSRPPFCTRPTYAIIVILTIENTSAHYSNTGNYCKDDTPGVNSPLAEVSTQ
jgi:hypothetical protein